MARRGSGLIGKSEGGGMCEVDYYGEGRQIPFMHKSEIAKCAGEVLEECWDEEFPVSVEAVCDYFGVAVVPVAGLFARFRVDAYIAADFRTIYVDEAEYENDSYRYRFSVAHELGHLVLHKEYFSSRVESYNEWSGLVGGSVCSMAEFQANYFAGSLLAPEDELIRQFNERFDGSFARYYWRTSRRECERAVASVQRFFRVSGQVMARRMRDAFVGLE